jgi:hypothetical protein
MSIRVALIILAAIAGYAAHALAQPRVDLRPAMTAIASSSSNGVSFAWFYDPAARSVVVCRAGAAPGDALECKAHTTLP